MKPWVGIWNATSAASPCLQLHQVGCVIQGEEDCLYLNVYTPKVRVSVMLLIFILISIKFIFQKLPEHGVSPLLDVMVYIHGGAFMFGNGGAISPDYIMQDNDLVFVSINYRVGALGENTFEYFFFLVWKSGSQIGSQGIRPSSCGIRIWDTV